MLHHIALGAQDVEAVASFYIDVLGLELCKRHLKEDGSTRSIWLWLSDQSVLMIEHAEHPRPAPDGPVIAQGPFLLAVSIEESQRAPLLEKLETLGQTLEASTSFTSYFRDPEGNRVAVSTYPLEELRGKRS